MGLNTYVGIADAHGIESWNRIEDTTVRDRSMKIIRADANRQRHAIYYEADMKNIHAEHVEENLKEGKWADALILLRECANEIRTMPNHAKSIKLIPNPDLDPWSS